MDEWAPLVIHLCCIVAVCAVCVIAFFYSQFQLAIYAQVIILSFHKSLSTICVGSVGIEAEGVGCWSCVANGGVLGGFAVGGVLAFGGVVVGGLLAFGGVVVGGVVDGGGLRFERSRSELLLLVVGCWLSVVDCCCQGKIGLCSSNRG